MVDVIEKSVLPIMIYVLIIVSHYTTTYKLLTRDLFLETNHHKRLKISLYEGGTPHKLLRIQIIERTF